MARLRCCLWAGHFYTKDSSSMDKNLVEATVNEVSNALCNGSHEQMVSAFDSLCFFDSLQVLIAALDHPEIGAPNRVANLLFDRLSENRSVSFDAFTKLNECEREAAAVNRRLRAVESNSDGSCQEVYKVLENLQRSYSDIEALAIVAIVASGSDSKHKLFARHITFCLENEHEIQL